MKTINNNNINKILVTAALILSSLTGVWAGEGNKTDMSQQISSQLSFPSELMKPNFNEKVKVDFKVKTDGSVEIVKIHSANTELKEHVAKQFAKLHFDEKQGIDTEKVYRIDVKYRVI